ncbi:MAG: 7-carboxy-7-deazaguanine synthase QueE [Candidatus Omnitrophica bacterium]|nr:7-carboxy-7-deazaguanine synthase QueE [Candidatus Omnitrophota bacterium]
MKARIAEIFRGIQGEGIYLGRKQIFVRFFGCNLNCQFCDTKLDSFREYQPEELLQELRSFNKEDIHSISFTGGEPLLQKDFLKEYLRSIQQKDFKIYLETNGTLPEELSQIIDYIDIIAMDIKLPSSTGLKDFLPLHKEFLKVALKKEVFIKTVICKSTIQKDLLNAVQLTESIDERIPFVLQPNFFEMDETLMHKLSYFKCLCLKRLKNVMIIPQMHKLVGIR